MRRLVFLAAVALVAGAMYVAAASGSQQSRGPTARQFNALKKQVATLNKTLKQVKSEADAAVGIIGTCYLTVNGGTASIMALPVSQLGNASSGFLYGTSVSSAPRSALDVATSNPLAYLQEVNSTCVTSAGSLRSGAIQSGSNRVLRWAEHSR